jgi:hypothetical protein
LSEGVELEIGVLLTRGDSGVPEQITHDCKVPKTFMQGVAAR